MLSIEPATADHLNVVLAWLEIEYNQAGEGFYCNKEIISSLFLRGEGLCAISGETVVGFAVFQMLGDGGKVQIIEVESSHRRYGIGSKLLLGAVGMLRRLSALYVDVECTSPEGEALCKRHAFEPYNDQKNYRHKWDNPTLRLYLSDWRPAKNPQ